MIRHLTLTAFASVAIIIKLIIALRYSTNC